MASAWRRSTLQDMTITKEQTLTSKASIASHSLPQYVFPAKLNPGGTQHASHTITLSSPATGSLSFSVADNQTCLIITLFCSDTPRSISLPANYTYSTFSATVPLDFTGNTDVEAYIAYSNDGKNVTLEKVTKVPAGIGLVLKKLDAATTATVPVLEDINSITPDEWEVLHRNFLKDVLGEPYSAEKLLALECDAYILESDTKFSKVVEGATGELAVGKAYLVYYGGPLKMNILDGEATAIKGIEVKPTHTNNVIYNLQGMRVNKPAAKGLYIVNGKARLYR